MQTDGVQGESEAVRAVLIAFRDGAPSPFETWWAHAARPLSTDQVLAAFVRLNGGLEGLRLLSREGLSSLYLQQLERTLGARSAKAVLRPIREAVAEPAPEFEPPAPSAASDSPVKSGRDWRRAAMWSALALGGLTGVGLILAPEPDRHPPERVARKAPAPTVAPPAQRPPEPRHAAVAPPRRASPPAQKPPVVAKAAELPRPEPKSAPPPAQKPPVVAKGAELPRPEPKLAPPSAQKPAVIAKSPEVPGPERNPAPPAPKPPVIAKAPELPKPELTPEPPPAIIVSKHIRVDMKRRRIAIYDDGKLVRLIEHCSFGRKGHGTPQLKNASLSISRREKMHRSRLYGGAAMPYALFLQERPNVAFHAGNVGERSHGCIHLRRQDAKWLFDWVGRDPVRVDIEVRGAPPEPQTELQNSERAAASRSIPASSVESDLAKQRRTIEVTGDSA